MVEKGENGSNCNYIKMLPDNGVDTGVSCGGSEKTLIVPSGKSVKCGYWF